MRTLANWFYVNIILWMLSPLIKRFLIWKHLMAHKLLYEQYGLRFLHDGTAYQVRRDGPWYRVTPRRRSKKGKRIPMLSQERS